MAVVFKGIPPAEIPDVIAYIQSKQVAAPAPDAAAPDAAAPASAATRRHRTPLRPAPPNQ